MRRRLWAHILAPPARRARLSPWIAFHRCGWKHKGKFRKLARWTLSEEPRQRHRLGTWLPVSDARLTHPILPAQRATPPPPGADSAARMRRRDGVGRTILDGQDLAPMPQRQVSCGRARVCLLTSWVWNNMCKKAFLLFGHKKGAHWNSPKRKKSYLPLVTMPVSRFIEERE